MDAEVSRFIQERTELRPVPFVPEVRLYQADAVYPLWELTAARFGAENLPYWAFPWAGGQALARYVLDNCHLLPGRRVLDLAAASGLVGIAAARAGARVTASEIDPLAQVALRLNADANDVVIEIAGDLLDDPDVVAEFVLAGDVFYDRAMSDRVLPFLRRAHQAGATVLIGDPKRHYLPYVEVSPVATYQVSVLPVLENVPVVSSSVWTFNQSPR